MTPHWPGLAGNAVAQLGQGALVVDEHVGVGRGGRVDAAAAGLLGHGLPHLVLGDAAGEASSPSARALRSRSSGPAVCAAAANVAERRRQRPASTQLTGIGVTDASASSTVRLRMRFCLAPTSSSPS